MEHQEAGTALGMLSSQRAQGGAQGWEFGAFTVWAETLLGAGGEGKPV